MIVAGWFTSEGTIEGIFAYIHAFQENQPMWLQVPMVMGEYLLAPTVLLLVLVLAVMKVSPQPRLWSRRLVVGILLILTVRSNSLS